MTGRNKSRGRSKAFVHPWRRYENEFRCWVCQNRRKWKIQQKIKRLKAVCNAAGADAAKMSDLSRQLARLEQLVALDQKIEQRINAAITAFYPTVLESAKRIVDLPYFAWLQLDKVDLASDWVVDMVEHNFCGYDIRKPFFCYGLFMLRRKCGNIARHESCRRCKAIPESTGCEDDPSLIVQVVEEFEQVYPLFCAFSEEEQEIFLRKYCLDHSSELIADDYDMTASAVDRLMWKCRLKVRKQLLAAKRHRAA